MVGLYFTQLRNGVMLRLNFVHVAFRCSWDIQIQLCSGQWHYKSNMLELNLELKDLEAENRF